MQTHEIQTINPKEVGIDPERLEHFFTPVRDLVFVGCTSGLVEESRSLTRWHLFFDLAHACVVD